MEAFLIVLAIIVVGASVYSTVKTFGNMDKLLTATKDYTKATHAYEAALIEMVDYFANKNRDLEKLARAVHVEDDLDLVNLDADRTREEQQSE